MVHSAVTKDDKRYLVDTLTRDVLDDGGPSSLELLIIQILAIQLLVVVLPNA